MHCYSQTFNETFILFGVDDKFKTDRVLDLIVLQAKLHILKCKFLGSTPSINVFQRAL